MEIDKKHGRFVSREEERGERIARMANRLAHDLRRFHKDDLFDDANDFGSVVGAIIGPLFTKTNDVLGLDPEKFPIDRSKVFAALLNGLIGYGMGEGLLSPQEDVRRANQN